MSQSRPVTAVLKGDTAGPKVLKGRLHKCTDEENRMQPIAAVRCCHPARSVAVGTPVNRIMALAGHEPLPS
jgi:hypothetical protein